MDPESHSRFDIFRYLPVIVRVPVLQIDRGDLFLLNHPPIVRHDSIPCRF
jgi:hypothetical protein